MQQNLAKIDNSDQSDQVLTKNWHKDLEAKSAASFINLPIQFQLHGYDYDYISKSYLNFFSSDTNTRQDKLALAKKFLKFTRQINKNRAREELGESFFICFEYFMENFSDLLSKQDYIHLDTLNVITDAIDKSQFVEDIISLDELQKRVANLKEVQKSEEAIEVEWDDFEAEYKLLNAPENRHEIFLLKAGEIENKDNKDEHSGDIEEK